jgi:hypothetical protein
MHIREQEGVNFQALVSVEEDVCLAGVGNATIMEKLGY